MNTARHPAAPTSADVALCNAIRTTMGPALYAGQWRGDRARDAIRLLEDMDRAEDAADPVTRLQAGRALLELAREHAPDLADTAHPSLPMAA